MNFINIFNNFIAPFVILFFLCLQLFMQEVYRTEEVGWFFPISFLTKKIVQYIAGVVLYIAGIILFFVCISLYYSTHLICWIATSVVFLMSIVLVVIIFIIKKRAMIYDVEHKGEQDIYDDKMWWHRKTIDRMILIYDGIVLLLFVLISIIRFLPIR